MRGRSLHKRSLQAGLLVGASFFASNVALAAPSAPAESQPATVTAAKQSGAIQDATQAESRDIDDLLFEDEGLDTAPTAKIGSPLTIDRADWAPDHAPRGMPLNEAAPEISKTATSKAAAPAKIKKATRDDPGLDPEPDEVITLPSNETSHDPLDRPKPAVAPKAEDKGKADDAGKQAEQPLPPANAAIKAALDKLGAMEIKGAQASEKKKERAAIAFFYASQGYAPAWSDKGKQIAAVDPILARLAKADADGLDVAVPATLKIDGSLEEQAESDIAISEAIVSYARQATGSRIDPHAISPLIGYKPDLADPAEVLDSLILAGADAGAKLHALNPPGARYAALRSKLAELRAEHAPRQAVTKIPPGPTLRLGMRDVRVPLIRSRFNLDQPLSGDGDDKELKYDSEVAAAVAGFQRANGLPASGNLTKGTIAALAGTTGRSSKKLEGAIIANMEIWRWMPRELGADRIEVNVPNYMVTVYHEGEVASENRVVVGKTDTPTPLFSNTMKFLIVNPVWNVPVSIIKNEFLPKGGGDLSYLTSHGYQVSYRNGQAIVKQPAGAKNALGRIKFMFPNDYSVYLHDTPSKSLFSTAKRAYSHGCVRVDKPFDFAQIVLNQTVPEGGKMLWSQQRLEKMLGDKERYVYLPKPLPIHIEYFTASVDDAGKVQLREDIYGYTRSVAAALGKETDPPPPPVAERKPPPVRAVAERRTRRVVERAPGPDEEVVNVRPAPPQAASGFFGALPFW